MSTFREHCNFTTSNLILSNSLLFALMKLLVTKFNNESTFNMNQNKEVTRKYIASWSNYVFYAYS